MKCERCGDETPQGAYDGERWVPICSTCLEYFGPPDDFEIDDDAGSRAREAEAEELERLG